MGIDDYISPPPPFYSEEQFNDPGYQMRVRDFFQRVAYRLNLINFLPPSGTISTDGKPLNIDAIWVVYVSNGTANTEDTVAHGLGRQPADMWVGLPDKSAVIYKGTTAWTSTQVFLKASAATVTVNLLLY